MDSMILCSLAWLLCHRVIPFVQGDDLQDLLPVFQILYEPSESQANEVTVDIPQVCVNLVQDGSIFSDGKVPM